MLLSPVDEINVFSLCYNFVIVKKRILNKNKMNKSIIKNISVNRRARHDYHLLEKYEAGLELLGMEVKSIRQNKVSLADSYVQIIGGEAWLIGMHISPYQQAGQFNPIRTQSQITFT